MERRRIHLECLWINDHRYYANGTGADQGGGGIFNNGGTLVVDDATISRIAADYGASSGGGVLTTDGEVTITNSEITNNDANRAGGGIEVITGDVLVKNVLLDGNTTGIGEGVPGNGGGLHVTGDTFVEVYGSTITNNIAAEESGGLWNSATGEMEVISTDI